MVLRRLESVSYGVIEIANAVSISGFRLQLPLQNLDSYYQSTYQSIWISEQESQVEP